MELVSRLENADAFPGRLRSKTMAFPSTLMPTDTTERGLEERVCRLLTGASCEPGSAAADGVEERPAAYGPAVLRIRRGLTTASSAWTFRSFRAFLRETQPETAAALGLDEDGPVAAEVP